MDIPIFSNISGLQYFLPVLLKYARCLTEPYLRPSGRHSSFGAIPYRRGDPGRRGIEEGPYPYAYGEQRIATDPQPGPEAYDYETCSCS
jgi:hypothetical protein